MEDIFKVLKRKNRLSGISYPEKLYLKNEGEIQNEGNKQKEERFVARKSHTTNTKGVL